MAAAVAAVVAGPTVDNRCVGGGGGVESQQQIADVPLAGAPKPAGRRRGTGRKAPRDSAAGNRGSLSPSPSSSFSSSPPSPPSSSASSSSDEDEHRGGVSEFGGRGVVAVKSPTVAVKRLKDLQQHLVDLDDLELLDRHLDADGDDDDDGSARTAMGADHDVAAELRQKNKDLVLAARLGKALLAKNDELSLMNERLAEEYGDKLEVFTVHDRVPEFPLHTHTHIGVGEGGMVWEVG